MIKKGFRPISAAWLSSPTPKDSSREERVENYHDFEKLAHVIQHGLQRFILKNIEVESTQANDLSHSSRI